MRFQRILLAVLLLSLFHACRAATAAPGEQPGMDPYAKDLIDAAAKAAGLLTVIGGALAVWLQFRRWEHDRSQSLQEQARTRALRAEELRWRKASLARDALGEFLADPLAADAMRMLDWDGRDYKVGEQTVTISQAKMLVALRIDNLKFSDEEVYVRDCFDAFFSHLQLIEHFLSVGLLEFKDVSYPASYYVGILARYRVQFEAFLSSYEYHKALAFLERFPEWQSRLRK